MSSLSLDSAGNNLAEGAVQSAPTNDDLKRKCAVPTVVLKMSPEPALA